MPSLYTMRQLVLASLSVLSFATIASSKSIFISPQKDLAFGLNIPNGNSTSDLFFSIAFPAHISWAAVGLGGSTMAANPLILMAYPSSSGRNVTISPRRSHGHTEPVYDPSISVRALPGTGLVNETTFLFNGVCNNCRTWSGDGKLDISSTAQEMSYSTGPSGDTRSDDPAESVKVHWNYGSFTMDLVHATTSGTSDDDNIPILKNSTTSTGTVTKLAKTNHMDTRATLHAVLMILVIVGMWPFGILVLKVGGSVKWHAINQVVAFAVFLIGAILGFVISGSYNRSKNFNTAHQILGIFIFIFAIAQLTLGFLHHRIFKKTQQTTKFAPIHVWLGRIIIPLGVANGFTGFPLALSPYYNYILLGVILFVIPVFFFVLLVKKVWKRFVRSSSSTGKDAEMEGEQNGYVMEPWRQQQPAGYVGRDPETPVRVGVPSQGARQFV
ncbi:iron reductase domain protein [Poronia punctata]|nr:iron reductase domain protein [Poronia punctata]